MQSPRFASRAIICASLFLTTSAFLAGCSNSLTPTVATNTVSVTGNWQFASAAVAAAKLPALSGELTGNATSMTGILHTNSASACVAPTTPIDITGATDATGITTLTSVDFPNGKLTITGTMASDGKSLTDTSYTVTGGSCAFAMPANATAQDFSPVTGTYTGGFSDSDGHLLNVTAALSQSPTSDANGNFTLSGTGTFPSNPCFNSPVSVSNTQVTGGNFQLTYADATTTNSVTATGTFSSDGTTLTVTNWILTGPCGPDTGTGLLTKQ
jgi:hypothetical protein